MKAHLKDMLMNLINDDQAAAEASFHTYLAAKMREQAVGQTEVSTPED